MNKTRRKAIEDLSAQLGGIQSAIEELRDEEQEFYDNMPESLQGGEKGDIAQQAIDALTEAADSAQQAIDSLEQAAA